MLRCSIRCRLAYDVVSSGTAFTGYRFIERFGIGLSYQVSEVDVVHEDDRSRKEFNIDLAGPSVYLTYGF